MSDHLAAPPPATSTLEPTAAMEVPPATPGAANERVAAGPIERDLAAIDAALARLDAGTYGTCEVCGDALEDAVLAVDPVARFCTGHLPGTVS